MIKQKAKQSEFSKQLNKKYKRVEGELSFSVEELRKSPYVVKKIEDAKETLKKYPITLELLGWK